MAFDPFSAAFSIGETIIKRIWPDPEQQAEALQKMAALQQQGDLAFLDSEVKLLTGQMEINLMEAKHGGLFKGGWRPFVGWTCGVALAYKFVIQPFLIFAVQTAAHFGGGELFPLEFLPEIEWSELSVILLGMLGLSASRTYEKRKTEQSSG